MKTLDHVSRQCQVFHFRTYPEFESLSRFRDKTHFPVFEYNPQFKTKLPFIKLQNKLMKRKLILRRLNKLLNYF